MNRLVAKIELQGGITLAINESSLPLMIGRGEDCGICLPVGHVSRKHCELYLDDLTLKLRDMSTNGTKVGRKRIHGDSIGIEERINVSIADDVRIAVTPFELTETLFKSEPKSEPIFELIYEPQPPDPSEERRSSNRREAERRGTNVIDVTFDRRKAECRRKFNRRTSKSAKCL